MKQEFFARQANEEIIRQERFHPGIFVIPVLCFVALLVPTLPLAIVASMTSRMLQQLNSHASYFSLLWLLPVALDFFIALAVFTVIFMAYESSQIILTNKRLVYRTGVISRSRGDLPLENVDSIFIFEPLIGRLAGYGTVTVATLGGLRVPLGFVGKPDVFYTALQRAVANAKNSRSQPAIDKSPVTAPLSADDSRYMPKSR